MEVTVFKNKTDQTFIYVIRGFMFYRKFNFRSLTRESCCGEHSKAILENSDKYLKKGCFMFAGTIDDLQLEICQKAKKFSDFVLPSLIAL